MSAARRTETAASEFSPAASSAYPLCGAVVSRLNEAAAFVPKYCLASSIHGLLFLAKNGVGRAERIFWLCAMVFSAVILQSWVHDNIQTYFDSPTATTILNNDVPIYEVDFPALSVCPNAMVRPSLAKHIIKGYLNRMPGNRSNAVSDDSVMTLLVVLDLYKFRSLYTMKPLLMRLHHLLPYMDGLSIVDLFDKTKPTCDHLLFACYWHGIKFNCCEKFFPAMSEHGLCYAFNSNTALGRFQCAQSGCRSTSNGAGTGLEIFFRAPNSSELAEVRQFRAKERALVASQTDDITALPALEYDLHFQLSAALAEAELLRVVVHSPREEADVSGGFLLNARKDERLTLSVTFTGSETTPAVRSLPVARRKCIYDGEVPSYWPANPEQRTYQQHACVVACRTKEILRLCGCLPYYTTFGPGAKASHIGVGPECRFTQLECLADIARRLVRMTAPSQPGFSKSASSPEQTTNCSHCLPGCDRATYTTRSGKSQATYFSISNFKGYIDLFFDPHVQPIVYQTDLAYDSITLLGVFGGIASLFLGSSMLSAAEVFTLGLQILQALLGLTDSSPSNTKHLSKKKTGRKISNLRI